MHARTLYKVDDEFLALLHWHKVRVVNVAQGRQHEQRALLQELLQVLVPRPVVQKAPDPAWGGHEKVGVQQQHHLCKLCTYKQWCQQRTSVVAMASARFRMLFTGKVYQ